MPKKKYWKKARRPVAYKSSLEVSASGGKTHKALEVSASGGKSHKALEVSASGGKSHKAPEVSASGGKSHKAPEVGASGGKSHKAPEVSASGGKSHKAPEVNASGGKSHKAPEVSASGGKSHKAPVVSASGGKSQKALGVSASGVQVKSALGLNVSRVDVQNVLGVKNTSPVKVQKVTSAKNASVQTKSSHESKQKSYHIGPDNLRIKSGKIPCVVQGNYNQSHSKYLTNSGKQCAANSLACIVKSEFKPISLWSASDLDNVLDYGNKVYSDVQRTMKTRHAFLLISELPKELHYGNSTLRLTYNEPFVGFVRGLSSNLPSEIALPMEDALDTVLGTSTACFLTFREQTVSVIKHDDRYYVFDSHSRDINGMQAESGKSVIMPVKNIEELYTHFQKLATSMGISPTDDEQFEITGVKVEVKTYPVPKNDMTENNPSPSEHCHVSTDSLDDIAILDWTKDGYYFQSLNFDNCAKICKELGVKNCTVELQIHAPVPMDKPCKTAPIKGDGNCFFRAISLAVSGTEDNHIRIRRTVVRHLENNTHLFTQHLRPQYQSIGDYVKTSRMGFSGTWATEVEVLATAHLLCSDIYTHSQNKWLRFSAQQVDPHCLITQEAVHLKHHHSHYDLVLCVTPENESICSICSVTAHMPILQNDKASKSTTTIKKRHRKRGLNSKVEERRQRRQLSHTNNQMETETPINKKRRKERMQYQTDLKFRESKKINRKRNYIENREEILDQQNELYYSQLKVSVAKKYKCDEHFRERVLRSSKKRYESDPIYKEKEKASSIRKYATNQEHRQIVKTTSTVKYATNQEHREKVQKFSINKYSTDAVHRDKVKQASIQKYATDPTHRKKVIQVSKDNYKKNPVYRAKTKLRNKETRSKIYDQNKRMTTVLKAFRESVSSGPEFVCCVCHRLLFENQVVNCCESGYRQSKASEKVASAAISYKYLHKCDENCPTECGIKKIRSSLWICYSCHRKLMKGKTPAEASVNNLHLDTIPEELECLNTLEQHLISLHIPFMKMINLPKGKQKAVGGPVVCIPSDISKTTSILPRPETEDQIIRVKLKRKLSYKRPYQYQFVNSLHIKRALGYLKENNKWYSDVHIDDTWENPFPDESESITEMSDHTPEDSHAGSDLEDVSPEVDTTEQRGDDFISMHSEHDDEVDEETHDELPDLDPQRDNENEDETLNGPLLDTCLQPLDMGQEVLDQGFDDTICVAPGEGNNPIMILSEESNEAKSFPVLFPKGSPTFHDNRDEKLTLSRYLHNRLMNADDRFAKDSNYIFHAQYRSEIQQVKSSISIAMRKGSSRTTDGKTITAGMLTDKAVLKDIMKADEGWRFLKEIRSTPAYWQSSQKDVFAMLRQLGIPTWFASFSSADMRWAEFIEVILRQHGDTRQAKDLDWTEKCDVLRSNPVTVARMFEHRFHNLLKNVILSPAAPIGKVKDYFYRVEFQQRGSPHTHCLFWVENAPKLDRDKDVEVTEFIDKYVTCEKPPADEVLHQTVSEVQTHSYKHSNSCRKKGTTCRFNFPRPPSSQTIIVRPKEKNDTHDSQEETEDSAMSVDDAKKLLSSIWEALSNPECEFKSIQDVFQYVKTTETQYQKAFHTMSKKASVILKRDVTDIWINPYNADLLKCWDANMDLQFILDAYSCVVYVVSYMSKAEREMSMLLNETQREIQRNGDVANKDAMKKLGTMYLHNREVSAQEAVYRVCNLKLKECSRKVVFIPVGQDPIKMSLPLDILKKQSQETAGEDINIWMTSLVDRYKNRPNGKEFDGMCLATFCSEFRVLYSSETQNINQSNINVYKLQNGLGFIQRRSRSSPAVVRYPRFSQVRTPEKYYHSILQLFLPHRSDGQLKPANFDSFEHFYLSGAVKCGKVTPVKQIVDTNRCRFEMESDTLERAQEIVEACGTLEDAWAQMCSETEREREECESTRPTEQDSDEEQTQSNFPDLLMSSKNNNRETNQSHMTRAEVQPILRSMNKKQSEIFYSVRQWCIDNANGRKPEPFHLFLTGPGGTGKSRVIKSVQYEACRILSRVMPNPDDSSVLLTAPTGVAAFNIGASTLHSAFSIRTDAKLPYIPLGEDKINTLRAKFENLQILIIDEISMVDHKMLAYVHGRLRQIKHCRDYSPFGKVSVLAVGDFYQLPPVKGTPLFVENPGVDLWNGVFAIAELDEIMRQQGDGDFAALLNRTRVSKKGESLPTEDITALQNRETGEQPDDALYIFATNAEVDKRNLETLHSRCSNPVVIKANDYIRDPRSGKLQIREKHHSKIYNSSLAESITLAEGARVMLIKNLDVSDGLVNGVFGTVRKIVTSPESSFPKTVHVTFDSDKVGQKIKKASANSEFPESIAIEPQEDTVNNKGGVRQQFPLKLAWASTVHKVQGLTVEKAVISFKKIFAAGQAYVAMSRVTSSDGLTIQDLNTDKIFCNPDIQEALSTMPPFIKELTDEPEHDMTIVLHNVQGLEPHFQDIKQDKRYTEADVICMTETWLTPLTDTEQLILEEFQLHHNPRATSYDSTRREYMSLRQQAHGGVAMYVHHNQSYLITDSTHNLEYMQCFFPDKDLIIVVLYRPQSYPIALFRNNLQNVLDELNDVSTHSMIMGDFNQNIAEGDSSILKQMSDNGYTQLVQKPTTESGTIIDHVYVRSNKPVQVKILPTYFSVHEAVQLNW